MKSISYPTLDGDSLGSIQSVKDELAVLGIDTGRFIVGTSGDDVLTGTPDADVILGLAGNDEILGKAGGDVIFGGSGSDEIYGDDTFSPSPGEEGFNRLFGGDGDDRLTGGAREDLLVGGPGNDVLMGGVAFYGTGDDILLGGTGDDQISAHRGVDFANGGPGNDSIVFGTGAPLLPPNFPDGQDTVQFDFCGAAGDGLGHDSLFLLNEDRISFHDETGRIDTVDELAAVTDFTDTGTNTYRLEWLSGNASIDIHVEPIYNATIDLDDFGSLQEFAQVVYVDFV